VQIDEPIFYRGSDPFVQSLGKQHVAYKNSNDHPNESEFVATQPNKSLEDTNVFFITETQSREAAKQKTADD